MFLNQVIFDFYEYCELYTICAFKGVQKSKIQDFF